MSSAGLVHARTIHLAADHAGLELKNIILTWLLGEGYQVVDHGAKVMNEEDDFPDFISLAAKAVSQSPENNSAIIFGGSGNGEAMMANRFPGVRAAVYYGGSPEIVALSRQHNDANVLSIGARFVSGEEAITVIKLWLNTEVLAEEKRLRRNKKIETITRQIRLS
jgi:ribose 5-phosphate isomerase B